MSGLYLPWSAPVSPKSGLNLPNIYYEPEHCFSLNQQEKETSLTKQIGKDYWTKRLLACGRRLENTDHVEDVEAANSCVSNMIHTAL